jgi:RimK family alpha-L-glutamate ligase
MTQDIWILDRFDADWEDLMLQDALRARGLSVEIVDWSTLTPCGNDGGFCSKGERIRPPALALVRSRVLTRHTEGDLALLYDWLSLLEDMGIRLVNSLESIRHCQNKVRQAATLAKAGIPVPETTAIRTLGDLEHCLRFWGDVVIKPIYGHASIDLARLRADGDGSGNGSVLGIREEIVAWHLLEHYRILCAQRFIPNPGRDLRLVVIHNTIVSCHYRISTAPDKSIKSLLHPYQRVQVQLTPPIERLALRAVTALKLDLATIDLVEAEEGPIIIEVNPTVSVWRPLERTTMDFTQSGITEFHADALIAFLNRNKEETK